jgi:hypothetical protein
MRRGETGFGSSDLSSEWCTVRFMGRFVTDPLACCYAYPKGLGAPLTLQKGLHIMDMRPLSRLAAGQNPGAIRLTYFQAMP